MTITFDKKTHLYLVDGDIATISVTELLRKHGLAPTYFKANESKRETGKAIHEDLENVCNSNRYVPKTEQGKQFKAWANENLLGAIAEQPLAIKIGDLIVAGTADILAVSKDNERIIADHKNMAHVQKESVAWQVSLYDYMARHIKPSEKLNGENFTWTGATKYLCFQYDDGKMNTIELEPIPDIEIEKLLWSEKNGEIYKKPELMIESELAKEIETAELVLAEAQRQVQVATERAKELRETLIAQMKQQGIKSWETDKVKITYIAPTKKETVDTKLLKILYPVQYLNCRKVSEVKECVRITIREKGES